MYCNIGVHAAECMWCQPLLFYKVSKVYDGTVTRGTAVGHVVLCIYMKSVCVMVRKYVQSENFPNVGQRSRSRSRAQNLWYHRKGVVIRNTHTKYESPGSEGEKVISKPKVWQTKFSQCRSKVTVKVTCSKSMVPSERCCHKEHTCQIWKPYLWRWKSNKQTKSVTDGQTDGRTDRQTDKVIPK